MRAALTGQIMVPDPGGLALGVLAGDQFGAPAGFFQADRAAQVGGKLRHAMRAHCRQSRVEVERQQSLHLRDSAAGKHGGEAGGDREKELALRRAR